eukprot:TRINITY_DN27230_c0_g1_i1.p1 TRINITY_DN27230_c0_g1~~TRINITY_DN27230_c0_g1_i1.p1  ORF type:complete len:287 (+),score=41.79 TRINITY_DN27230_c0_g1_i1:93-863(+)
MLASGGKPPPGSKQQKNMSSYYKRPSAALERGGGFFVPGLEGYKLRAAMGALVFVFLVLNRYPGYEVDPPQLRSETIGAFCGALLLLQALLDRATEQAATERRAALDTTSADPEDSDVGSEVGLAGGGTRLRRVASSLTQAQADRVGWVADTLLQLTPACTVLLVTAAGEVVARFGVSDAQEEEAVPMPLLDSAAKTASLNSSSAALKALPSACAQALAVRCSSNSVLLLGTTLRGAGVWNDVDTVWVERLGAYMS